jgi:ribose 5-phosphate isomerase A
MNLEALKEQAAKQAVSHIKSGMRVGLGTGSTAKYAILELGRLLAAGELHGIVGVATSNASQDLALSLGILMEPLDPRPLDLAIDGADEIDPQLNLIKGLGGALLREKMVEVQAKELIVIADHLKPVDFLGQKTPLPIEVVPFGLEGTLARLTDFGTPELRLEADGRPYVTDNGNYICHLRFDARDVVSLERQLKGTLGVVETGFFLSMATLAYIASPEGVVVQRKTPSKKMYGEDK